MPIARRLADLLRGLRDRVDEAPSGAVSDEEEPDDVGLDAWRVIELQETGWEVLLVDLRAPGDRAAEVPAGAKVVSEAAALAGEVETPDDGHVVFVCATGRRSLAVATALRAAGHDRAWSLNGGVRAWIAAGGAVEPG
jgi:rhodanese-related sulfurtransferase